MSQNDEAYPSYPYFEIARDTGVAYADVLALVKLADEPIDIDKQHLLLLSRIPGLVKMEIDHARRREQRRRRGDVPTLWDLEERERALQRRIARIVQQHRRTADPIIERASRIHARRPPHSHIYSPAGLSAEQHQTIASMMLPETAPPPGKEP